MAADTPPRAGRTRNSRPAQSIGHFKPIVVVCFAEKEPRHRV